MTDVTKILLTIDNGDPTAAEQLLPLVYHELRRLAAAKLAREKPGQTLQATALVHDAYLRLVDVENAQHWESRGHFFAAAAEAMRRILVERARHKLAIKAGGEYARIELADVHFTLGPAPDRLLVLDEALSKLGLEDPLAAEIAKLRLFVGLTIEEAAEGLALSRSTAFREWAYARAFLQAELGDE